MGYLPESNRKEKKEETSRTDILNYKSRKLVLSTLTFSLLF